MNLLHKVLLGIIAISSVATWITVSHPKANPSLGSVAQAGEYNSTTTPLVVANWPAIATIIPAASATTTCMNMATTTTTTTAYRCPGVLGSVIITKSDTGAFSGYDATTTDVNLRAPTMATSSILVFSFVASPTAGTYTFDSNLKNGLIVVSQGTMSSTTITYR